MNVAAVVDVAAGVLIVGAGCFSISRGSRIAGFWLCLAGIAWLAGSMTPVLALAHRAPLVAALLVGAPYRRRLASTGLVGALVGAAGATLWLRGAWMTIALGVALIAVAWSPRLSRSRWSALQSPGCAYGLLLVSVAVPRAVGASGGSSTAVAYSVGVVAVVAHLVAVALKPGAERLAIDLAAAGPGGSLEDRLRVALSDPTLRLTLEPAPDEHPRTEGVTELLRSGQLVGELHHRRGLRIDRQLVEGLGAIVGLASDAKRLRLATAEAVAHIEKAGRNLTFARHREAVLLADQVIQGPMVQLDRALARVGHLPAAVQIAAAQGELLAVAEGLAPSRLEREGLRGALEARAALSPVPVHVVIDEGLQLLPEVTYAVFLICSEALTNAIKHSSAKRAAIRVAATPSGLEVEVSDDGCGGADLDGSGVRGLRDRATSIGGRLAVSSPVGGGTNVRLVVPIADVAE